MIRFTTVALCALMLAGQSSAVIRGGVGISLESSTLMDALSSMSANSSTPSLHALGFRLSPTEVFDLDFSYGIMLISGVDEDTASGTLESPSQLAHAFSAGAVVNVVEGDDALFGLYGKFTGALSKENIQPQNGPYVSYVSFTPKLGLGFEPSYYFSSSFSVYFRAGVGLSFMPASKRAVLKSGFDGSEADHYDLQDHEDSRLKFGTDGLALGLRFLFGY